MTNLRWFKKIWGCSLLSLKFSNHAEWGFWVFKKKACKNWSYFFTGKSTPRDKQACSSKILHSIWSEQNWGSIFFGLGSRLKKINSKVLVDVEKVIYIVLLSLESSFDGINIFILNKKIKAREKGGKNAMKTECPATKRHVPENSPLCLKSGGCFSLAGVNFFWPTAPGINWGRVQRSTSLGPPGSLGVGLGGIPT